MQELIEALSIFNKYTGEDVVFAEHNRILVMVNPTDVHAIDRKVLSRLGFEPDVARELFYSDRRQD